jgi:hypothetical protein
MQTSFIFALALGLAGASCIPTAFAADDSVLEQMAKASWRHDMAHIATPAEGCYHASYPSVVWQQVACQSAPARAPALSPRARSAAAQTASSATSDYVLGTTSTISEAVGSFPVYSGVLSLKSGTSSNEYALRMDAGMYSTAACKGHSGCTVWQQFMYVTDYDVVGEGSVFMQDWLIGWGSSSCPSGFGSDGEGDCYKNSALAVSPDIAAKSLGSATLTGTAVTGGNDTAVLTYGEDAYSSSQKDSTLDLASVWDQVEYNIFGTDGQATFNSGVSITVNIAVDDGSKVAPSCDADGTSMADVNNLLLGSCTASGESTPSISFTESN